MSIIRNLTDFLINGPPSEGRKAGRQAMDIQKQDAEIRKQDALDRQREHEMQFHEALMQQGYKPSMNGLVNEELSAPGMQGPAGGGDLPAGVPGGSVPRVTGNLLRPVDPSRLFKFKDSSGQEVSYERPNSLLDQLKYQWDAGAPVRDEAVEQHRRTAEAGAKGTAQGKIAADTENLANNGVDLSEEDAARLGLPSGARMLRTEIGSLAGKVMPAQVRATSQAAASKYRVDLTTQTQQAIATRKAELDKQKIETQQAWNKVRERIEGTNEAGRNSRFSQGEAGRNSRAANAQSGMNARHKASFAADEKRHGETVDKAFAEEQRMLQATALLGETEEPGMLGGLFGSNKVRAVEDGQEFIDPWTGKKATMNVFQRERIKNALTTSQRKHEDLTKRAEEIASRYGLNGGAAQETAAPVVPAKTTGDKVKVKTSKGIGLIPRANLAAAKALDPTLQVLTQ